ncbi:MAG: HK97 gp10 family phage protein [Ignavibacteria bacterium]|jgi:hypothetical protein|nr:HK97 gp10 family phage protein [Ignavibacteria bacterium]
MNISFKVDGDFSNTEAWLRKMSNLRPPSTLEKIANDGVEKLSSATPIDTGETASGWKSEITTNGNITEVVWKNTAHPESPVNVAKLIELGHGTKNGGYVQPHPYIKEAMKPVWESVEKVTKELIK